MREPRIYIASYHPVCLCKKKYRTAETSDGYVDASIRREPDLELPYPTISALCRLDVFAPHLIVGDRVVYVGVLGNYPGQEGNSYPLTAILEVLRRFDSHQEARYHYRSRGWREPYNSICSPHAWKSCCQEKDKNLWLEEYRLRYDGQRTNPKARSREIKNPERVQCMLACKSLYLSLDHPPHLTMHDLEQALIYRLKGKSRLGTQNPCTIREEEYQKLITLPKVSSHQGWCLSPDWPSFD